MAQAEIRSWEGKMVTDDRGTVSFVNDFSFADVKRFYVVKNHQAGFIRAWHAHQREGKYVTVLQGAAIIAAVPVANWEQPDTNAPVSRFILSGSAPTVLYIPPGHANGARSLTADTMIVYFSTATVEESRGDDFRYPAKYWDPWSIEER